MIMIIIMIWINKGTRGKEREKGILYWSGRLWIGEI